MRLDREARLKRILIMTPSWAGHVNPLLGVADWLQRTDHHVGWVFVDGPPRAAPAGFEDVPVDIPQEHRTPADVQRADWRVEYYRRKAERVEPLRAAIRRFRPQVIAMDALYESMIAAELEGIPYGRIHTSLTLVAPSSIECEVFRSARQFEAQRFELFERFGLTPEFHNFHTLSPWFNAVFATAEFVGNGPFPPRTILAGPSIVPRSRRDATAFDRRALAPGQPLAYVSFGTVVAPSERLLRTITAALVEHGMQVVVRAQDLRYEPNRKAHVVVVEHAPQIELLETASLFVTHGGANSVMESLHAGVPMLVVPHTSEQPIQAHFVSAAGVGLSQDPAHVELAACRALVGSLVQTPGFRVRARQLQEAYRRADGARVVAEELAKLG